MARWSASCSTSSTISASRTNTIVIYSTDNGAEIVSWPDGGCAPFHGEKGTTWEGGHRVPLLLRWPSVIKPGTQVNEIIAHNDWLPTFLAAAGEPNIKEKLLLMRRILDLRVV